MDKKVLRNDIILVASLLLVAIISLVVVLSTRQKHLTTAKVYVENELQLTINLSKNEEYIVHGKNGDLFSCKNGFPYSVQVRQKSISEAVLFLPSAFAVSR